jgi:hypothetical protein
MPPFFLAFDFFIVRQTIHTTKQIKIKPPRHIVSKLVRKRIVPGESSPIDPTEMSILSAIGSRALSFLSRLPLLPLPFPRNLSPFLFPVLLLVLLPPSPALSARGEAVGFVSARAVPVMLEVDKVVGSSDTKGDSGSSRPFLGAEGSVSGKAVDVIRGIKVVNVGA